MAHRKDKTLWKSIDWITIALYLTLVICGWFSICGASFDYGSPDLFSWESRSGKQLIWIGCSFVLGFILLMLEEKLYELFAYLFYILMMALLLVTPYLANDDGVKGSWSWIQFGSVSIQPAEFAKFATALALSRFMSTYGFILTKPRNFIRAIGMILLPMLLIIMQRETGSALVYSAFFLVLYREGMSGSILFTAVSAVIYFIIGIRFGSDPFLTPHTSAGQFIVLLLALLFTIGMVYNYGTVKGVVKQLTIGVLSLTGIGVLFCRYVIPFDLSWLLIAQCVAVSLYLLYLALRHGIRNYALIALFTIGSVAFLYSCQQVLSNLDTHQSTRIEVLLGMRDDPHGAGYNVNQSKIAIGSGGLTGKGFLGGTQTKLKYVPEQDTDFIFCTVGEEMGFIGCSFVLLLYATFILRLLHLAESQSHAFGRIYGYCLVSLFLFHLFVNVGMVLGIAPVIGIPLPFFSYGGSSLWSFSLLLFSFLRINAWYNNKT